MAERAGRTQFGSHLHALATTLLAFCAYLVACGAAPGGLEEHGDATQSRATGGLGESNARAQETESAMTYVYNAPESALDRRYEYHWEILEAALERTRGKYGPFILRPSVHMSEKRQTMELMRATGRISVMYLGTTPEFEQQLLPVRIPVDKNLGGYCVFLIRQEDQPRFAAVRTLEELRGFSIGLGLDWVDVGILRSNQFKVVTGSSYDGLFDMLVSRRFDAFSRAAVEIIGEYESRRATLPDLAIEQTLVLYYPLPMYFWFSKTVLGKQLAARVEEGMRSMLADGSYDRIFFKHQQSKIDRLHLRDRRIFRIENPFLVPETPFADKALWFDPMLAASPP